jgi:predicted transposase/invertase (TIGR01784 family)
MKKFKIGRYVDPLTDFGFKLIFGNEPNKDLLIAFLNELFKGRKVIVDLVYNKTEHHGPLNNFRKSVFDLTCTGADGEQFIIEVQRIYQQFFIDRAVYYTSKLIHAQGPRGNAKWDFKLKEVYFIGILDFEMHGNTSKSYIQWARLTNELTGTPIYNKLGYIFIELPKFNKMEKQLKTELDKWLYVLKNMASLKKIPVFLTKRIFEKVFKIAEVSNLTKEEYMKYEKDLMAEWTEYAILKTAEDKGREEGREEGHEEIVINLIKNMGLNDSQIAKMSGLQVGFIKKVRAKMKD